MFTDTHCHLDFEDFDPDRPAVIARAQAAGLSLLINPGVDLSSSLAALRLSDQWPGLLYAAVGVHPNYAQNFDGASLASLRELASSPSVVALGEIGLDYYHQDTPRARQQEAFEAQLQLAAELGLPVLIHDREATADLLPILLAWKSTLPPQSRLAAHPGVMHSWSGDLASSQALLEAGFCFGVGGPLTYKNAEERREVVRSLPLQSLLLETDAPFLAPQAQRGRRNEPAYIPQIAQQIALVKGLSLAEVARQTTRSAFELFNLPMPPEASSGF